MRNCFIKSFLSVTAFLLLSLVSNPQLTKNIRKQIRERISINDSWRFMRHTSEPDKLIYDKRPEVTDRNDNIVADSKPTESVKVESGESVLKRWILLTRIETIRD